MKKIELFAMICFGFAIQPEFALGQNARVKDTSYSGYQDIVRELASEESTEVRTTVERSEFDHIRFHVSVGAVTSAVNLTGGAGTPSSANLQGTEAVLGVDLFSKRWVAEGALRNYGSEIADRFKVSLQEFDLRVVHQIPVQNRVDLRWGFGMAARYLDLTGAQGSTEYTTPASLLMVGGRFYFNHIVGIVADLAYRSRMVNDTIDRGSVDGSIRIIGTF
jgi:hypothetical protein